MTKEEFNYKLLKSLNCKECGFRDECTEDEQSENPEVDCAELVIKLLGKVGNEESNTYKERMAKEYRELKERYNKLHRIIVRYEAGTLDFELNCPIELLKTQKRAMGQYLLTLEIRAEIEGVTLE